MHADTVHKQDNIFCCLQKRHLQMLNTDVKTPQAMIGARPIKVNGRDRKIDCLP